MTKRTVVITGAAGFLGETLGRRRPREVAIAATMRRSRPGPFGDRNPADSVHAIDLASSDQLIELIEATQPAAVVHTAYQVADGQQHIVELTDSVATACAAAGVRLVHVSSDVVFSGDGAPYGENAALDPIDDYGRHKAEAERIVGERCPEAAVVRTSLLTRADPIDPRSAWVLGATDATLFTDEIRCPAHVDDVADGLWELALSPDDVAGPWHLVGPEAVSRHQLGSMILAARGEDPATLRTARSVDQPVRRPLDLTLTAERTEQHLRVSMRPVSRIFVSGHR